MKRYKLYSLLFAGVLTIMVVKANSATTTINQFRYEYTPHHSITPQTKNEIAYRFGSESVYVIPPVLGGIIGGFIGGTIIWIPWTFMVASTNSLSARDTALNMGRSVSESRNTQWKNIGLITVSDLVSSCLFLGYELQNRFYNENN